MRLTPLKMLCKVLEINTLKEMNPISNQTEAAGSLCFPIAAAGAPGFFLQSSCAPLKQMALPGDYIFSYWYKSHRNVQWDSSVMLSNGYQNTTLHNQITTACLQMELPVTQLPMYYSLQRGATRKIVGQQGKV